MSSTNRLAHWDARLAAYLLNRRSLGRAYLKEEQILRSLRKYLAAVRARDLSHELFDQWRNSFRNLNPNTRLARERAVYNFLRYRRRAEPRCFLPDPTSFARSKPHPSPTIIEPSQVAQMLELASKLEPGARSPLRPAVMRLALVLLYTAGLRRREVVRLTLEDVEPKSGVLRIRESKFHKSRWIVLSPTACAELRQYLTARQHCGFDSQPSAPLLCNARRGARCYSAGGLANSLSRLFDAAGVRSEAGHRVRLHALRHSFATAALLRWYEAGEDVQVNLPKLSMYMGHCSIASTAYYLRCMPAVVAKANERFEHHYGALVNGVVS